MVEEKEEIKNELSEIEVLNKKIEELTEKNKMLEEKVLYKDAFKAFKIIDEAFSVLYGTVPLTDAVIKKAIDEFFALT